MSGPVALPDRLTKEYKQWIRTFERSSRFRMAEGEGVVGDVRRAVMRGMGVTEADLDSTDPVSGVRVSTTVDNEVIRIMGWTAVITDATAPLCRAYWISFFFCAAPRPQTKFEVSTDPVSIIAPGGDAGGGRKNKQWRIGACVGPWVDPSEADAIVAELRSGNRGVHNRLAATIRVGRQHGRVTFAINPAQVELGNK